MSMMFLKNSYSPILTALLAMGATVSISSSAIAAMPPAGSVIGNQASAEYTINGQLFKVTSNLVQTIIDKKAALTLTADQTKLGTLGSTVYFPHQITNTGNTADTFNLTSSVTSGGLTNVLFYLDANGDGIPDSSVPITSTSILQQGDVFNFIAAVNVPSSGSVPGTGSFTVTATSQLDNTQKPVNTDTVTYTNAGVVNVTKAMTPANPAPGDTVTVTLTYTNVGNVASGPVTISDPLPTNLNYVAASGLWSSSGATALTDAVAGDPAGINYSYTGATRTVLAVINSVAAGATGQVTFRTTIGASAPAGNLTNIAQISCDCDNNPGTPDTGPTPTNPTTVDVQTVSSVSITDVGSTTDNGTGANSGDGKVEPPSPVPAGSTVMFDNVIVNNGNAIDTFNIKLSASSFPAGTSLTLVKADGVTPLTDTNNDGIVDTGPVAIGGNYHVFVRALLPANATGSGPFAVTKTATSINDSSKTSSITDQLTSGVIAASMDLTNTATGSDTGTGTTDGGWGPGAETVPQTTVATNPNTTASFNLYINHGSAVVGTYVLEYSTSPTFATVNVLPTGWGVTFYDGSNNAINSATINGMTGSTPTQFAYTAKVTVPADALAGNYPIYFRARSTALNLSDIKYDRVTVNTVHDVSLTPSNIGQVFAGSSKVYMHTLRNLGNVTETSGAISVVSSVSGWNAVAYLDSNNNAVFDPATDIVLTNISQISGGLVAAGSQNIFVVVQSPASALPGDSQLATVSATVAGDINTANNTATDQTSIMSGSVDLLKKQAPDAGCDGTADSAFTVDDITMKPDQCIMYEVTATNIGLNPVTTLDIYDQTPQFTTISTAPTVAGTAAAGSVIAAPAVGATGQVKARWATVNSAGTAILRFAVKINNN